MSWYTNQKTMTKLITAFAIVTIVMMVVGYLGYSNMLAVEESVEDVYETTCWLMTRVPWPDFEVPLPTTTRTFEKSLSSTKKAT